MAYMSQEEKQTIAAALKTVVPKDWKYSLAVRHHQAIVMTIKSAPVELMPKDQNDHYRKGYASINVYHPHCFYEGALLETIRSIIRALNTGNYNRSDSQSDSQSDYFDVGHYVYLNIGSYEKPFVFTGVTAEEKSEIHDAVKFASLDQPLTNAGL